MILVSIALALAQQAPPVPAEPVRPRDPFVFRCVLDKRARMLVAALDEEMWAAWDTTNGAFVKAWKGGVAFDGAVYTTVHGPQPTSRGSAYVSAELPAPFGVTVEGRSDWQSTKYVGYTLASGHLVLEWEIAFFRSGRKVLIREMPEFTRVKLGRDSLDASVREREAPALRRDFEVIGLQPGEEISVKIPQSGVQQTLGAVLQRARFLDAQGVLKTSDIEVAWAELVLTPEAPHRAVTSVFASIAAPAVEKTK